MQLNLRYDPGPDTMAQFAADIVEAVHEVRSIDLDYSVESLDRVDELVEQMRGDGSSADTDGEALFGFGCYVGEVLVRQAGGVWRDATQTTLAGATGFPLVIELGAERFCDPISRVFARLQNGPADGLALFFGTVVPKQ